MIAAIAELNVEIRRADKDGGLKVMAAFRVMLRALFQNLVTITSIVPVCYRNERRLSVLRYRCQLRLFLCFV